MGGPRVCKKTVAAPMAAITVSVDKVPAYSKVMVYVDGKPYPRAGHNTLTYTSAVSSADATKKIKLYKLSTRVQHTVVLVLATNKGDVLGMNKLTFKVSYTGGCAQNAAGQECGNKGVCHSGYCVCFDGYFGLGCENAFTETNALTAPTTCVHKTTFKPFAASCMSGGSPIAAGTYCTGTTDAKCVAFKATDQYRARTDAGLQDGIASTRFINSMQRAETTAQVAKVTTAALGKKTSIQSTLESKIFDTSSTLATDLASAAAATATNVKGLYNKIDRNAISIQQARLESVRLATANKEQWLDSQRSLYAHQTAMQNRLDKDYQAIKIKTATWTSTLNTNFKQARFIKNQLKTANGPRVKVADLKTETCTTDQFFKTTCTSSAIPSSGTGSFTTTTDADIASTIPR